MPGLVRFKKSSYTRTLLDQTAQWLPQGRWATNRWYPKRPIVPQAILEKVEAKLLQEVINGKAD